jgi:alcohol dehydrogenase class IV
VAALFPAWISRIAEVAPASLARLARAAGIAPEDVPDGVAAARLVAEVLALRDRIGMRTSLGSLGVRAEDVPELVARVEGAVTNDPGPTEPGDLRDLYLASL